jgi:hypothetical protein
MVPLLTFNSRRVAAVAAVYSRFCLSIAALTFSTIDSVINYIRNFISDGIIALDVGSDCYFSVYCDDS